MPVLLPTEDSRHTKSRQCSDSAIFTLDPQAKYSSPKSSVNYDNAPNPLTLPSLASSHSLYPKLDRQRARVSDLNRAKTSQGLCVSLPSASFFFAVFHKMRRTKSSPAANEVHKNQSQGSFKSIRGSSHRFNGQMYEAQRYASIHHVHSRPRLPASTPQRPSASSESTWAAPPMVAPLPQHIDANGIPVGNENPKSYGSRSTTGKQLESPNGDRLTTLGEVNSLQQGSNEQSYIDPAGGCAEQQTFLLQSSTIAPGAASVKTTIEDGTQILQTKPHQPGDVEDNLNTAHDAESPFVLPIQSNARPPEDQAGNTSLITTNSNAERSRRPPSLLNDDKKTLTTYCIEYPRCADPSSPHYLSQPESPSVRDFEEESSTIENDYPTSASEGPTNEDDLPVPTGDSGDFHLQMPQLASPGFSPMYHLPREEKASVDTLRDNSLSRKQNTLSVVDENYRVQSWNDGGDERRVGGDAVVTNDLGYLAQVVS